MQTVLKEEYIRFYATLAKNARTKRRRKQFRKMVRIVVQPVDTAPGV